MFPDGIRKETTMKPGAAAAGKAKSTPNTSTANHRRTVTA
jgi:hypothetical protein